MAQPLQLIFPDQVICYYHNGCTFPHANISGDVSILGSGEAFVLKHVRVCTNMWHFAACACVSPIQGETEALLGPPAPLELLAAAIQAAAITKCLCQKGSDRLI